MNLAARLCARLNDDRHELENIKNKFQEVKDSILATAEQLPDDQKTPIIDKIKKIRFVTPGPANDKV